MNRDRLFLRLVEELSRTANGDAQDDFELLQASAHLRKLLLDDDPLMHQVNRERRVKITFRAAKEDDYVALVLSDRPSFWAWMDGFSPRMALRPNASVETLKLDRLLAKRAAVIANHDVSVRDVILQIANVSGGVHFGVPRTDVQRRMAETSEFIQVGGVSSVARTLRGVADVVIDGLEPLTAKVRTDLDA